MDWEFGISRCKLLFREWINSKVLLYSTGNYIQYPMIKHNGKEYEKEYIYICVTESLCCLAETNTTFVNQLHFNKINLSAQLGQILDKRYKDTKKNPTANFEEAGAKTGCQEQKRGTAHAPCTQRHFRSGQNT